MRCVATAWTEAQLRLVSADEAQPVCLLGMIPKGIHYFICDLIIYRSPIHTSIMAILVPKTLTLYINIFLFGIADVFIRLNVFFIL